MNIYRKNIASVFYSTQVVIFIEIKIKKKLLTVLQIRNQSYSHTGVGNDVLKYKTVRNKSLNSTKKFNALKVGFWVKVSFLSKRLFGHLSFKMMAMHFLK